MQILAHSSPIRLTPYALWLSSTLFFLNVTRSPTSRPLKISSVSLLQGQSLPCSPSALRGEGCGGRSRLSRDICWDLRAAFYLRLVSKLRITGNHDRIKPRRFFFVGDVPQRLLGSGVAVIFVDEVCFLCGSYAVDRLCEWRACWSLWRLRLYR